MKALISKLAWLIAVLLLLPHAATPTHASLYWNAGLRSNPISVCFVGNALAARPDRVQQILTYIKRFEYAANIKFNPSGTCPPPTKQPNGNDYYDGDIRVVIPGINVSGTGPVPGVGCLMFLDQNGNYNGQNDGWGSWSNAPNDLPINRPCLYNLKLGDDPWNATPYLNHTLHEFGHALGLAHEHQRTDVNAGCTEPGYGGNASSGFLTPYDRRSVMHYKFESCGINGNYDNTGLSDWDRLGLHILYPENNRAAEYIGTTVVRQFSTLVLQSDWKARGAYFNPAAPVAHNFSWQQKIGSGPYVTVSTTPDLVMAMNDAGDHQFRLSYDDFLGRSYTQTFVVHVVDNATYNQLIATPAALSALLLAATQGVYLPLIAGP